MARNTKQNAPQPVVGTNPASAGVQPNQPKVETETEPKGEVVSIKGAGTRKSAFTAVTNAKTDAARDKMRVMGTIRQSLAEAADLFRAGTDSEKQAVEVASKAALALYQARADNLVSAAEVSAALGDEFGYKMKADNTPGKTPAGQGEAIRKRIVRAAQAHDYVMNGDGGKFFEGLPAAEVNSILASMETGDIGFWAAYEAFAELKRDNAVKTIPAFNHKHIAGLVDALSEKGAADNFKNNPELVATYAALIDILRIVGEKIAEDAEAEAAAEDAEAATA